MQQGPAGQPPQKTTTAQEAEAVADPQEQTEREAQVMTNLPRRRPQRRSERRTSGAGGVRRPLWFDRPLRPVPEAYKLPDR
jgi:hypothetical protein